MRGMLEVSLFLVILASKKVELWCSIPVNFFPFAPFRRGSSDYATVPLYIHVVSVITKKLGLRCGMPRGCDYSYVDASWNYKVDPLIL